MNDQTDSQLLRDYAERRSEPAFAELVRRYVNFVYSAALRMVCDSHLAEDVAQGVFLALAKNAAQLTDRPVLSGWLHRTSQNIAAQTVRSDVRRRAREQEAAAMNELLSAEPDSTWEHIAPHLDDALGELSEPDRDALLLRYFEQKSAQEMGQILGLSDEAAQKRVSRAVERLREFFAKLGVTVGASGLVLIITANSVQAAPAGLAISLAGAAVKGAAAASTNSGLITGGLKLIAGTKAKTAIGSVLGMLLIAATVVVQRSSQTPHGSKMRLPVGKGVPLISMGHSHGLILASDGSLWSWGTNHVGWPVLGLGEIDIQPNLRRIGQETDWVTIATSADFSLAVKADGTVWAWGQNAYHQLGDGTEITRRTPSRSVTGSDWKQVAAGAASSFGLKTDGTLWSWGDDGEGNLGIGSTIQSREPVRIGSQTNWTKVWAGGLQTLGLQSDGSLWFWGTLTGSSSDTNRFLVPTRVSADTNWVDVGFGYFVIFAIKADGTLWVWGRNAGMYTDSPIQLLNPTPVQVGTNNDWQACSSSEYFYRVLRKKDGSLWSLDASDYAVINKASYKPVELKRVNLQKDVVAFGAAGRGVTGVALTRDGEVWTWGKVLGESTPAHPTLQSLARRLGWKTDRFQAKPVIRDQPWQLPNTE